MKESFAEFIKHTLDIGETIIWRSYPDLEAMRTHIALSAKSKLVPWLLLTIMMVVGIILEFKFNKILGANTITVVSLSIELFLALAFVIICSLQLIKNIRHLNQADFIAKNTVYVVTDKHLFVVRPDMLLGGWKYHKVSLWLLQGLITKEFADIHEFGSIYFVHNDHHKAEKLAKNSLFSANGFMFVRDLDNVTSLIEKVKGRHFHSRSDSA